MSVIRLRDSNTYCLNVFCLMFQRSNVQSAAFETTSTEHSCYSKMTSFKMFIFLTNLSNILQH